MEFLQSASLNPAGTHAPYAALRPAHCRSAVTEDELSERLDDGRTIVTPLAWYPRLLHATVAERSRFEIIGRGQGLHWPDVDEDLSVEGMLAGRTSPGAAASLARWLARRLAWRAAPQSV